MSFRIKKLFKWSKILISSFFFALFFILILEIFVRIFSEVKFVGHSKSLFENADRYRNAKNTEAISFGQKVFLDRFGHRVSSKEFHKKIEFNKKRILFLGDSVAFGAGVKFENTFHGILENSNKNYHFINTSVIGHGVNDYEKILDEVLSNNLIKKDDIVLLLFCLNDISSISGKNIREFRNLNHLNESKIKQNYLRMEITNSSFLLNEDFVRALKKVHFINKLNLFLRQNSKLYLLVKGTVTNPSKTYFFHETNLYKSLGKEGISKKLLPIINIQKKLEMKDIKFKVIVLPFSYQLKNDDQSLMYPQKLLSQFFKNNKVPFIDATNYLMKRTANPLNLYLKFDPMHFSSLGHLFVSQLLQKIIDNKLSYKDKP